MKERNDLAYYNNGKGTVVEGFIVTPWACTIKLFTAVIVAVS
jgi:hypothetical protein